MEGAAPTTASEGAAKQPVAEATSPPREGKAPAEPAAAGGAVAASPPPAGAVAAAAPTAAPTAASGLRSFGELSTLPNCIRVSSVVYLSNVVERASRMLGIGGQSAAATTTDGTAAVAAPAAPAVEGGGSSTPPPPPPAEGAVVAQTFDTVHIVALGMAISRVATIVSALKARAPHLVTVVELTIMPIADSIEFTPAICVTVRKAEGAGGAELAALSAPLLAGHELLQPHPKALPVANDRISLEGDVPGGRTTGRTGGGGRGGRGGRRHGGGRGSGGGGRPARGGGGGGGGGSGGGTAGETGGGTGGGTGSGTGGGGDGGGGAAAGPPAVV